MDCLSGGVHVTPYLFNFHRVVQTNLVFVIGLSPRLADPEVLKKNEFFGKYGRIYKVVINNHTVYSGAQVCVCVCVISPTQLPPSSLTGSECKCVCDVL